MQVQIEPPQDKGLIDIYTHTHTHTHTYIAIISNEFTTSNRHYCLAPG
jgi:hypothetical protein